MLYQIEEWKTVRDKLFNEFKITSKKSQIGVDDFYLSGTVMHEVPNFENLTDEELFKHLKALQPITGEIYVVVDICYRNGFGPFLLEAERLEGLIEHHYEMFKQMFFDTDAIIISFLQKKVWMFHHSGFVGLFDYSRLFH